MPFDINAFIKGADISNIIAKLKLKRIYELPDIEKLKEQWDIYQHKTFDPVLRPDRRLKDESGNLESIQPVNRLAFPLQKRIVNMAVSFNFGNPVKLICSPNGSAEQNLFKILSSLQYKTKEKSFNRNVARDIFRGTECAEYWYAAPVDTDNQDGAEGRLRCVKLSPWDMSTLYPFWDSHMNLIAFSREFCQLDDNANEMLYFEVYTDKWHILWKYNGGTWSVDLEEPLPYGKIPIVYGRQEKSEWHDVQCSIERLEVLLSNFAEIVDYNANPKIFVTGSLTGIGKKGQAGQILEGEPDADAKYLTWDQAPEAVKLEIETLLRFIYTFTQTPDISFDSVKGLQAISGIALQMLFMDAHLKVQDKRELFDDYLQRRINIQLAILSNLDNTLAAPAKTIRVEPEITPYMIDDVSTLVANLVKANGNKPIISQKKSVALSGMVDDPDKEYEQITKEEETASSFNMFEPTN